MRRRRLEEQAHTGHVWWARLQEAFPAHGWVSEQDSARLRFITPFARRLQPGDTIAISSCHDSKLDDKAPRMTYRVLGITPYDNALTLVDCTVDEVAQA